jgi:hypothetical protein
MPKKGTKRVGFRKLNKTKRGGSSSRSGSSLRKLAALHYFSSASMSKKSEPVTFYEAFWVLIIFVVVANIFGKTSSINLPGPIHPRDLSKVTYSVSKMPSLSSQISLKPDNVKPMISKLPNFVVPGEFNIETELRKLGIREDVVEKTERLLPPKLRSVDVYYLLETNQADFIRKQRTLKELLADLLKLTDENPDIKKQFIAAVGDVEAALKRWANEETFKSLDVEKK